MVCGRNLGDGTQGGKEIAIAQVALVQVGVGRSAAGGVCRTAVEQRIGGISGGRRIAIGAFGVGGGQVETQEPLVDQIGEHAGRTAGRQFPQRLAQVMRVGRIASMTTSLDSTCT